MSKLIISADSLKAHLNKELKYFLSYDLDLSSVLACGMAVMSSEVPEVACQHLVDDLKSIGRFQVLDNELFDIIMSSSATLKTIIKHLVGYEVQHAYLVGFSGSDPIINTDVL